MVLKSFLQFFMSIDKSINKFKKIVTKEHFGSYIGEGGEKVDFEEVYQAYFKEVYLYIKSLSRDANIAEEITQEAFFKALKSIEKFDGSKDIRAWLFTIAKNTYFSHYKKSKRTMDSEIEASGTQVQLLSHLMN